MTQYHDGPLMDVELTNREVDVRGTFQFYFVEEACPKMVRGINRPAKLNGYLPKMFRDLVPPTSTTSALLLDSRENLLYLLGTLLSENFALKDQGVYRIFSEADPPFFPIAAFHFTISKKKHSLDIFTYFWSYSSSSYSHQYGLPAGKATPEYIDSFDAPFAKLIRKETDYGYGPSVETTVIGPKSKLEMEIYVRDFIKTFRESRMFKAMRDNNREYIGTNVWLYDVMYLTLCAIMPHWISDPEDEDAGYDHHPHYFPNHTCYINFIIFIMSETAKTTEPPYREFAFEVLQRVKNAAFASTVQSTLFRKFHQ